MAKKEEVKEPTTEVEPKPEEPKEPEAKVEQASKEELEQLRTELQKAEGRWQSAQGVISKQNTEIQALKDNQELWKVLIGMRAQEMGVSEEEAEQDIQKKKPDFMQQYSMMEQRLEQKRLREKVDSYQAITEEELGLKPGDEDYDVIQAFVRSGNWKKADKKIESLKSKKTEQPEEKKVDEKKETEEERIERLADEKKKAWLLEKGYVTPEGAEPSAPSPKGFAKIEQDYADGLISTAEYEKAMDTYGKR
jgi:hypothetical protein